MKYLYLIIINLYCIVASAQQVYELGDIVELGGHKAIIFEIDDEGLHGKAMNVKALRGISHPLGSSSKLIKGVASLCTLDNGNENTSCILSQAREKDELHNLKAITWCTEMGPGWYIPSLKELESFIEFWVGNKKVLDWDDEDSETDTKDLGTYSREVNHKLLDAGGTPFKNRVYSSSVDKKGHIYVFFYNYKNQNWNFELKSCSAVDDAYTGRAFIKF